jgi:hypothetical protein
MALLFLIIGLFVFIVIYLAFVGNKYDQALKRLKEDPDNRELYLGVIRIGQEHMYYKRQRHIAHMQSVHPDTLRELFVIEAEMRYGNDRIKEDIYRVVGKTYT